MQHLAQVPYLGNHSDGTSFATTNPPEKIATRESPTGNVSQVLLPTTTVGTLKNRGKMHGMVRDTQLRNHSGGRLVVKRPPPGKDEP